VARWLKKHPATYEATISKERFKIIYPGSTKWSFDIKISDIKRFEHRNTLSHAGKGIGKTGVLLLNGKFYEICGNYGPNINKMHAVIRTIRPEVPSHSKPTRAVFSSENLTGLVCNILSGIINIMDKSDYFLKVVWAIIPVD
jgi:hypothetical protein